MSGSKPIGRVLGVGALCLLMAGCAGVNPTGVRVAEEKSVQGCTYIETISEVSDMGRFQFHPKYDYDARETVLRRAEALGATHVVWVGDYAFGSAAMAYRCAD